MPGGLNAKATGALATGTVVDATGCDIGVYNPTNSLKGVTIENATQYGVYVDHTSANVTGATVSTIGDTPLDGMQYGDGIYYTNGATGTISGNTVTHYQKNGIVATGTGTNVAITGNTVTGEGPIGYTAQNGIEFARGATGSASGNTVSGNEYTGPGGASSGGIIVFGGPGYGVPYSTGISISKNTATNNDVGVWLSNADSSGNAPLTPTNNSVVNNTISKPDGFTNLSGGTSGGYQAGIADQGNKDNHRQQQDQRLRVHHHTANRSALRARPGSGHHPRPQQQLIPVIG